MQTMTKDLAKVNTAELLAQMKAARVRAVHADAVEYGCAYCEQIASEGGFGPSHVASERCESGHREHCTCDTCF